MCFDALTCKRYGLSILSETMTRRELGSPATQHDSSEVVPQAMADISVAIALLHPSDSCGNLGFVDCPALRASAARTLGGSHRDRGDSTQRRRLGSRRRGVRCGDARWGGLRGHRWLFDSSHYGSSTDRSSCPHHCTVGFCGSALSKFSSCTVFGRPRAPNLRTAR